MEAFSNRTDHRKSDKEIWYGDKTVKKIRSYCYYWPSKNTNSNFIDVLPAHSRGGLVLFL